MPKEAPHILIVEDEPGIAELLYFTLINAGFSTEIAGTAAAARHAVATCLPQLVLLDWMLPDTSGLNLLQEWRADARMAKLVVIMLTAKGMDEDKVRGLNAGADDYVTKPFSPRELIARIHALLRAGIALTTQTHGMISIDTERHVATVGGVALALDQAEFKLLRFLMAHPERIFSRAQLLAQVWGDQAVMEERTVDVHIMRLRKSLGAAADYIKTVRNAGYMLTRELRT